MRTLLTILLLTSGRLSADSGVVRVSAVDGPWRLTVFSEPTPLRAGPVDLSVLVQHSDTHAAVLDATISMLLSPVADDTQSILVEATRAAATNRLLYSALLDLPSAGRWSFEVTAMMDGQQARVSFEADVGPPMPPLLDQWIWFALPLIVIALIIINQWLQRRGPRRASTGAPGI
jgi:hypothetical protein